MVLEHLAEYPSLTAACEAVARREGVGQVDDIGALADSAVGVQGGLPRVIRHLPVQGGRGLGQLEPDRVRQASAREPAQELLGPTEPSARTGTFRPGQAALTPGSARSASFVTAMWSAAVFEPAFAGRSLIATRALSGA
jgi:hypothetical protein